MTADSKMALVADIGGTNARFALTDLNAATPELLHEKSLPAADYASLQHAAEAYLAHLHLNTSYMARPTSAAIAVASPVGGDEIRLTNRAWSFSKIELQRALGLTHLTVLNDFGAVAHAVPGLAEHERVVLHNEPSASLRGPISVLGPGTGLGVALLVGDAHTGWNVVETEGGHVSFAPLGEEEAHIARWLNAKFGRTSNERLLCGAGLSHIEAALSGMEHPSLTLGAEPLREPAQIVAAALDGHDLLARKALARFCAVLGSVAGDTALMHGARSVVIAGGMVPRFLPFLRTSAFRERFLAKGRFAAYLERVSVCVITHPNPGLLGAAVALRAVRGDQA
jgi:glucokinase